MTDLKNDDTQMVDSTKNENSNSAIDTQPDEFKIDLGNTDTIIQESSDSSITSIEEGKKITSDTTEDTTSKTNQSLDNFEDSDDLFDKSESVSEDPKLGEDEIISKPLKDTNSSVDSTQSDENINIFKEQEQQPETPKFEVSSEEQINEKKLEEISSSVDEKGNDISKQDEPNNEIFLGKFENPMINTVNDETLNKSEDISPLVLEHPTVFENSQSLEASPVGLTEDQQKAKLAQKEKIAQLIKVHETKAQKSGFIKGILSGVVLSIGIILAGFIIAKEQIINLISEPELNSPEISANIIDIANNTSDDESIEINDNTDEETSNEETSDEETSDEETSDEETSDEEILINNEIVDEEELTNNEDTDNTEVIIDEINEDFYNELANDITSTEMSDDDLIIDDEIIDNSESTINETTEDIYDESINDITNESNDLEINESNNNRYTIINVNSEEEANWVLPAHCSDITCYGKYKEFTPCTSFRLSENLDENANRIGNNGVCRYKDTSELVFIQFN